MTKTTHLPPYEQFRESLVMVRKTKNWSQEEFGRKLGKRQSYVSKVETGERRLDLVEFIRWSQALEVDPVVFMARLVDQLGAPVEATWGTQRGEHQTRQKKQKVTTKREPIDR